MYLDFQYNLLKKEKVMSENKTIAYIRASTEKQNIDSQKLELLEYARRNNIHIDEFVEIKISSRRSPEARKIKEVVEILAENDLLLVSEISRVGRSIGEIFRIMDQLVKKKINFVAVKEGINFCGKQNMQTKTMITMFSLFAEIERDLISERTKQGLEAARRMGKQLGRPKGPGKSRLDKYKEEIITLLKNGATKTYIAKRYKSNVSNFYRWLKKHNINVKPEM